MRFGHISVCGWVRRSAPRRLIRAPDTDAGTEHRYDAEEEKRLTLSGCCHGSNIGWKRAARWIRDLRVVLFLDYRARYGWPALVGAWAARGERRRGQALVGAGR